MQQPLPGPPNVKPPASKRSRRLQANLQLFLSLCRGVADFMTANQGGQFRAYLSPRESGALGLYLVTASEPYDFARSSRLAAFAGPYIERGLLDSVTLLPASAPDEMTAFFDPDSALRVEIDHA